MNAAATDAAFVEQPTAGGAVASRTAVLVIHGIGNQRPLETLRAAADAIYVSNNAIPKRPGEPAVWFTFNRDDPSRDIDLPVLTTGDLSADGDPPHYADFHECYWADLMSETRFVAVPLWLFDLVRKGPSRMRPEIKLLWPAIAWVVNLWVAAFVFLGISAMRWMTGTIFSWWQGPLFVLVMSLGLSGVLMAGRGVMMMVVVFLLAWLGHVGLNLLNLLSSSTGGNPFATLPFTVGELVDLWTALGLAAMFVFVNSFVLTTVVGDAARYYRVSPANIVARRATRRRAVDRLRALHNDPRYDRIIVVAHSLGTVIGYDMLRAYWSEICFDLGDPSQNPDFMRQDRQDGRATTFDPATWRAAKGGLLVALPTLPKASKHRGRWIVSDFVTLGSPLTHAAFLMTEGTTAAEIDASFERKRNERELPQDPAWRVGADGTLIFTALHPPRAFLHAAALFAMTRWTNIYFPLSATILGDVVGGKVGDVFGPGVLDQQVGFGCLSRLSAHTHYFDLKNPAAEHLKVLRDAVDLTRKTVDSR